MNWYLIQFPVLNLSKKSSATDFGTSKKYINDICVVHISTWHATLPKISSIGESHDGSNQFRYRSFMRNILLCIFLGALKGFAL